MKFIPLAALAVAIAGAAWWRYSKQDDWLSWPVFIVWPDGYTTEEKEKLLASFLVDYKAHKLSEFVASQINEVHFYIPSNIPIADKMERAAELLADNGRPVFFFGTTVKRRGTWA